MVTLTEEATKKVTELLAQETEDMALCSRKARGMLRLQLRNVF